MLQPQAAIADLVARIAFMSKFGEAIRERREVLELDGPELALKSQELELQDPITFQRFSQQTFSRWESDRTGALISASHPRRLRALAYLLKWSAEEMHQKLGVHPGHVPGRDAADAEESSMRARHVGPFATIRNFGTVSAGEQAFVTDEHQYIELPDFVLDGYDPDDCFAMTVVGDSMTDEGARDSITEGSVAVFHEHLQPEAGEIVAAWLDDPEYGELRVLKVHKPDNGFITLHSFNRRVKPIVVSHDADFHIFGVFLGAWNPGPRLRHRGDTRELKARIRRDLKRIKDAND